MNYSEGLTGAPPINEVPLELLEEMLWFFRVEDATPWNCSMFVLVALVVMISFILLGRNIQANRLSGSIRLSKVTSETRNQKKLRPEKQTPEVLYLAEGGNKDDKNLTILTETLLSEKPTLAQGEMEAKCKDVPRVHFPDPEESEN